VTARLNFGTPARSRRGRRRNNRGARIEIVCSAFASFSAGSICAVTRLLRIRIQVLQKIRIPRPRMRHFEQAVVEPHLRRVRVLRAQPMDVAFYFDLLRAGRARSSCPGRIAANGVGRLVVTDALDDVAVAQAHLVAGNRRNTLSADSRKIFAARSKARARAAACACPVPVFAGGWAPRIPLLFPPGSSR